MDNTFAVSSWSGGKESCLACYQAIRTGYQVKYLLNFISRDSGRGCFHGIEGALMHLQARLIGIPLIQEKVSPDMAEYEKEFKKAVNRLKAEGITSMVFGDVYLDEHQNWVERVCKELEIRPIEPLWGTDPADVMEAFINAGFKAIVVSCKADLFGKEFIGRIIDKDMVRELKGRKICPCGENGEFHTLVVDGPIFNSRIKITRSKPILRQGFWKHWFLDIQEYTTI